MFKKAEAVKICVAWSLDNLQSFTLIHLSTEKYGFVWKMGGSSTKFHGCKKIPFPLFYLMATIWGYPCFYGQTKTYQIVDRPPNHGRVFLQSQSQKVPKYLGDLEYIYIYENMRYIMLSSNYDPGCTCFHDLPFWGPCHHGKNQKNQLPLAGARDRLQVRKQWRSSRWHRAWRASGAQCLGEKKTGIKKWLIHRGKWWDLILM